VSSTFGAAAATVVVGSFIALQAPINSGLGKATDTFAAAVISFGVGLVVLVAIATVAGQIGAVSDAPSVRWYYLIGGLLGAVYVTTALITVKSIGAGGVAAATVTGQLTAAVVIDRLGLFGLEQTSLSATRIVGVVLLLAGTFLVVR